MHDQLQRLEELARAEAQLAHLDRQRAQAQARIDTLRTQTAARPSAPTLGAQLALPRPIPTTPGAKVELFRRLFRGRPDVYPTRFVSRKTGRPGYAPACSNKFVPGVCGLPRVKCGECPNQAFLPADAAAVLEHLRGRHVMGVYPLLQDETCWFLAVDFDQTGWRDDVQAFAQTCRNRHVPYSIERSRSGEGGHVWVFFSAPVPAHLARGMGCSLLTETMARRHQLTMRSYDRLFPNQDTLPRGGFGNLIALPLQSEARKKGNTVFLDDQLEPYADQWAYLASVTLMDPGDVEALARDATRRGQVVGVRAVDAEEGELDTSPWTRPPSRGSRVPAVPTPLPVRVRAVLAQRLYVEKAGLPLALIDWIKRLAAFENPEFYKRQRMRLSTALTPRVIACAEDLDLHISLPRGCLSALESVLQEHRVAFDLDDQRQAGEAQEWRFHGELTPVQRKAADALRPHENGVFVAPPGVGKTVLGTYLIAQRNTSTLVMVHRRPLLDQWVAQLSMFLGIETSAIGRFGNGRKNPNGRLDVAMLQSLVRRGRVDDRVARYGQVIVDECHHVPAVSFERVLSEVKARHVLGLTATPYRRDGQHPILEMQLGPVRYAVDARGGAGERPFEQRLLIRETAFHADAGGESCGIQRLYGALAADPARNDRILDDVIRAVDEGRSPILLTERTTQLDYFAQRLPRAVRHGVVLRGGMTPKAQREVAAQLASIPNAEERVVLATGRYIGEGFDDVRLDTLFLAMPVSWKGTLVQYAGRLQRLHPGKREIRIYDYVDRDVPLLARMFQRRYRAYRALGYGLEDATLPQPTEVVLDYDAEPSRAAV